MTEPPRPRGGLARGAVALLAFCAAFACCAAAVDALLPFPNVEGVERRLERFRRAKDEYDAIFIGSSRVRGHVIPREFDERVAALTGRRLRTFNFGIDGMVPPESFYLLRHVLEMRPARLRWVFIEGTKIDPCRHNLTSRRAAYWHDWRHTRLYLAARRDAGVWGRALWRLRVTHGMALVRNWVSLGRGAEDLRHLLEPAAPAVASPARRWEEGYQGFPPRPLSPNGLKRYEAALARFRQKRTRATLGKNLRAAYVELGGELRARGIEPLVIFMPGLVHYADPPRGLPALDLALPERYPQLYVAANHYDGGHLNVHGAREMTALLADWFVETAAARAK